jgi:hypothetical protein
MSDSIVVKAFERASRAAAIDMLANLADMVREQANAVDIMTDPLGAASRHNVANAIGNLALNAAQLFNDAYLQRGARPLDALEAGVPYDRPLVEGDEASGFTLRAREGQRQ